jgi:septum formation protein
LSDFSHRSNPILVLASASPRRSEILRALGVSFVLAPSDVEEPRPEAGDESTPALWVEKLARFKAECCEWQSESTPAVILAADTIVWHKGRILNKPRDAGEAVTMLSTLRGQTHTVFTGVCLRLQNGGQPEYSALHEATNVTFGDVSDEWIEKYVATGEPMDKAGSYAAQGKGALLISRIEGDFWNVVGLPLFRVSKMLQSVGVPVEKFWSSDS